MAADEKPKVNPWEAVYYPLIGNKDNARTLQARISEVRRLAGLESEEMT